jgi:hypothetical protein
VLPQVIPKVRNGLTGLSKATEEHKPLLGHLLYVAAQVGSGLQSSFITSSSIQLQ